MRDYEALHTVHLRQQENILIYDNIGDRNRNKADAE